MAHGRLSFEVNRISSAPPETLFALETDGANWSQWSKPVIAQSSWDRQGDHEPGGLGAIRKVGLWPMFLREETVGYEQDRRHVYRFIGPFQPVRDYRAEVVFAPTPAGGTDLRWTASFRASSLPGVDLATLFLNRMIIRALAARLIRAAERINQQATTDQRSRL
ncbi:SRPBCC family protein [Nocardia sp. NBC_01499]|uniref:SRPBCC family protein n=1 Tax=Nocardia sp. NBC_01499 TaxID=2903597 RepID=UPI003869F3BF